MKSLLSLKFSNLGRFRVYVYPGPFDGVSVTRTYFRIDFDDSNLFSNLCVKFVVL